ncbi:MAG: hypothetical protein M1833_002064 [Piccolia ochrophora]|nr:MAG: hypothetical protein M1833_002064 [Piccolia ochrophora]
MAVTTAELQARSRYIRDTLSPLVASTGGIALSRGTFASLLLLLTKLDDCSVDVDMLRVSRIDKALLDICSLGSRWPDALVDEAKRITEKWEIEFGKLGDIRAALWEKGGRMAGCWRGEVGEWRDMQLRTVKKKWIVDASNKEAARYYGPLNFEVGDWWIKSACAYRDGMLDDAESHISIGEQGAHAIVMARGVETEMETNSGTTRWRCTNNDVKLASNGRGVLALMGNMRTRTEVRVLRYWKLNSKLAPRAGLRFDGMYSIVAHGVKICKGITFFTFQLQRSANQPGMEKALTHPRSDEHDDWLDYMKYKEERKVAKRSSNSPSVLLLNAIKDMDGIYESSDIEDKENWEALKARLPRPSGRRGLRRWKREALSDL